MNVADRILIAILRDVTHWRDPGRLSEFCELPMGASGSHDRRDRSAISQAIDAAALGLVRINLAGWLGNSLSDSQRVMAGRVMVKLEQDGLVVRHALAGFLQRFTHVELTEAGLARAAELLAAQSPEAADA